MLAVVQLLLVVYRSILVGLGPLDIRYIIVCELPSPLPRASAIARALPAMLAVVQSLLVDVRQFPVSLDAISVASSRWCCLAPPLSPAPCPHYFLSSSSTGRCWVVSRFARWFCRELPSAHPRASALARALPATLAVVTFLSGRCSTAYRLARWHHYLRAPVGRLLPRASAVARALPAMLAVVQFPLVDARRSLDCPML